MNTVTLMGRLTKDVAVNTSAGDNSVGRFTLAVNRRFKNSEGKYDADFINCVAFGKSADFIAKYFQKGDMMAITGRIQTGSYKNKDGNTVYTTDVVVETTDFCGAKGSPSEGAAPKSTNNAGAYVNIPKDVASDEDELPFQ